MLMSIEIRQSVRDDLLRQKFGLVRATDFTLSGATRSAWDDLRREYEVMGRDVYYPGQGEMRRMRRYSRFMFDPATGQLTRLPEEAYYQSARQNGVAGGIQRRFDVVSDRTAENPFFRSLVPLDFAQFPIPAEHLDRQWIAHVHQIRVVVEAAKAAPVAPEGIHSDGYPFASLHLVRRSNVLGGDSALYDADGTELFATSLRHPLDTIYFEDGRLKHSVTPIQGLPGAVGIRDILAVSFSLPNSGFEVDI
jgi:hypothetical protein